MSWTGRFSPYEPRWFHSVDGRMHYIDDGLRQRRPVVMHGSPTRVWQPPADRRLPARTPRRAERRGRRPLRQMEEQLRLHFRDKPVGVAWALKDIAFPKEGPEQLWLGTLRDADLLVSPTQATVPRRTPTRRSSQRRSITCGASQ